MGHHKEKPLGFTIVELLIVVVVIAILAAITIVSYNGITNRAKVSVLMSDLDNASKKIELYKVQSGMDRYPDNLDQAEIKASSGTTFEYSADNVSSAATFCLVALNGSLKYSISNTQSISETTCGANLAVNPSLEADLSGWFAGSGAIARSSARSFHGQYSLAVTSSGASNGDRYVYTLVPITRPAAYTVSAKVYLEANGTTDYGRGMWVNNVPSTSGNSVPYNGSILNTWQTTVINYVASSGSTALGVRFYVMPGATLYVDDLKVIAQP